MQLGGGERGGKDQKRQPAHDCAGEQLPESHGDRVVMKADELEIGDVQSKEKGAQKNQQVADPRRNPQLSVKGEKNHAAHGGQAQKECPRTRTPVAEGPDDERHHHDIRCSQKGGIGDGGFSLTDDLRKKGEKKNDAGPDSVQDHAGRGRTDFSEKTREDKQRADGKTDQQDPGSAQTRAYGVLGCGKPAAPDQGDQDEHPGRTAP